MMKSSILTLLFLGISSVATTQEIRWMSFEEALKAQKKEPKKIIMDVYTTWCGPCKLLDRNTFQNPDVSRYINEYYHAVKFNAEGQEIINFYDTTFKNLNFDPKRKGQNSLHQFTQFLGIQGYPTLVFFGEDGDPIMPVTGYLSPQQLELYLKMIEQEDYKVFDSADDFEKYKKNFVPKFKG